jgi:hypothetical protein
VLLSVANGWIAAPWALVLGGVTGAAVAGLFGHD